MPDFAPQQQITSRVVATFSDYPGMIQAMRDRANERRIAITSPDVAAAAGLADHYIAKLLSPRPVKRIGVISMGPLLAILGCKLQLVDDPVALAKYANRLPQRREEFVHAATVQITLTRRRLRAIQRKGGQNSRLYMSKRQASALARKAAKVRWQSRSGS